MELLVLWNVVIDLLVITPGLTHASHVLYH